ncbi:hypothetical protein NMY22_g16002 [Coprinellus aureogranulatus]|nr:hypothetical protein NMY22_g16002 [Coprinellus aureogranulatus]
MRTLGTANAKQPGQSASSKLVFPAPQSLSSHGRRDLVPAAARLDHASSSQDLKSCCRESCETSYLS